MGRRTADRGNVRESFLWADGWADSGQKETLKLRFRVAPIQGASFSLKYIFSQIIRYTRHLIEIGDLQKKQC